MRSAPEILNVIEAAELEMSNTFFIHRPTWELITKALNFCLGKTKEEIEAHILKCEDKRDNGMKLLSNNWQLIIESMKWVIEETDIDPIQSRRNLIPFA